MNIKLKKKAFVFFLKLLTFCMNEKNNENVNFPISKLINFSNEYMYTYIINNDFMIFSIEFFFKY